MTSLAGKDLELVVGNDEVETAWGAGALAAGKTVACDRGRGLALKFVFVRAAHARATSHGGVVLEGNYSGRVRIGAG